LDLILYQQDSFFTLSGWGQVGLASISIALFALMVFSAWILLRRQDLLVRILGALFLFWLFVWMSPQVYYQYYRFLFDGLPAQWVISPFDDPFQTFKLLFWQGPSNLSAHSQGILGWSLIAVQFFKRPQSTR